MCEDDAKSALIGKIMAAGYTSRHEFEGEYTFLMNPMTCDSVRVYSASNIWRKDQEYPDSAPDTRWGTTTTTTTKEAQ